MKSNKKEKKQNKLTKVEKNWLKEIKNNCGRIKTIEQFLGTINDVRKLKQKRNPDCY